MTNIYVPKAVAQLILLDGDQRVASLSLISGGVTVLCFLEQDTICCLVLVQPRKTCPDITEKLFTGT